jgi:hypothetical protein
MFGQLEDFTNEDNKSGRQIAHFMSMLFGRVFNFSSFFLKVFITASET